MSATGAGGRRHDGRPARVAFHTFGCKLNQHETEAIASAFLREGHAAVRARDAADLYVVNTCTVTAAGDHKARALVRSLLRDRPGVPVVVTGCSSQLEAATFAGLGADVVVVGQDRKALLLGLPAALRGEVPTGAGAAAAIRGWLAGPGAGHPDPFAFRIDASPFHTRAFLKVQDGCDCRCAYCRVPPARGPSVSLGAEEAAARAAALEERGFREIVVTGVNLSAWRDGPRRTAHLVEALLAATRRVRLRVSSLEPESIDDGLAAALTHPRVCAHFHLPVQSGSDRVLASMGRRYAAAAVVEAVGRLRRAKDDPFVAADILVGFPGETGADFEATRALVERLDFAQLHVFPYSPRPGTRAVSLRPRVPERVARERAAELGTVSTRLLSAYRERWAGREVEALLERGAGAAGAGGRWLGVCGNYLKAWIRGVPAGTGKGDLVRATLGGGEADADYLGPA
jgi:threonylcarbamoyladenosine tRNA methylthiotransferase MtaB